MRFINKWSYDCANYIMKKMDQNNEKRRVYYFSFQVIFGQAFQILLILSFSLLFRSFVPTLVIMLAYAILRMSAGGYHMNTFGKCTFISFIIYITSGAIVQYTYKSWGLEFLYAFTAIAFILVLAAVIKWAPKDNPNRVIDKSDEKVKFKIQSVIVVLAWTVLSVFLLLNKLNIYVIAGYVGLLLESITITPAGYSFFEKLNMRLDGAGAAGNKLKG